MPSLVAPDLTVAVARYHAQGYLHVPGVYADDLEALRAALEAVPTENRPWDGAWLDPEEKTRFSLRVKQDVHHASPVWAQALAKPDVLEIIGACLGATPSLAQVCVVTKPPAVGQPFPMHQDSAYYGPPDGRYVIVTVYLDDATPENGPIQFVEGSHRLGALEHVRKGKAHLPQYALADSVPVYAKAGDITLFSINTIHGSGPNVSSAPRRTVRAGYRCA